MHCLNPNSMTGYQGMFKELKVDSDLSSMIERVYDRKLDVSGGWGYSKEDATIIHNLQNNPINQFEYNLAHMRAYLEMNITQPKENRYSNINLIEKDRQKIDGYDLVSYEVSGMLEDEYASFIDEYKDGYGNAEFDLEDHFARRKKSTLTRVVEYWFLHP